MTDNPNKISPHFPDKRCHYISPKRRQCRLLVLDPEGVFCPRHVRMQSNPNDFTFLLFQRAAGFQNAQGINKSLATLYALLADDSISPRRASILAYISSLLLRTLPAIENERYQKERREAMAPKNNFAPRPNSSQTSAAQPRPISAGKPLPATASEFADLVFKAVNQTPATDPTRLAQPAVEAVESVSR